MANVLCLKLVPFSDDILKEYQGAFWRGRSPLDQIFTKRQILEKLGT